MYRLTYFICLTLFVSCMTHNTRKENNRFAPSEHQSDFIKLNRVLYYNINSKNYYYDMFNTCDKFELRTRKKQYECIRDTEGNCVNDIDLESFRDMGTFYFDKKYFFFIKMQTNTIEVKASFIDTFLSGYYFENSYYRIRNHNLEYWGQIWKSDTIITCFKQPVVDNIELDKLKIIDAGYNENGCSLNAYAVYKGKMLFHGCWLNIERIDVHLKKKLIKAIKSERFARMVEI